MGGAKGCCHGNQTALPSRVKTQTVNDTYFIFWLWLCRVARRFVGLIDRAKNLCQRSYSTSHHDRFGGHLLELYICLSVCYLSLSLIFSMVLSCSDAMTVCMASAFLLNTHYYHHLIACDHPITPGKVR